MIVPALLLTGWLVAAGSSALALAGWRLNSDNMTVCAIVGMVAGVALVVAGLGVATQ